MKPFRFLLSLVLVMVTTLLVSCGGPTATVPPTYTPEKIAEIQKIATPIEVSRDSMSKLKDFIQEQNWVDADTFIHGPLGELRTSMTYLSRILLPEDQKLATNLTKELFGDFEKIDAAAKTKNYSLAAQQYNEAIKDFDAFLKLIPSEST